MDWGGAALAANADYFFYRMTIAVRPSHRRSVWMPLVIVMLVHANDALAGQSSQSLRVLNQYKGQLVFVQRFVLREETLVRVVAASDNEVLVQLGGVDTPIPRRDIRRVSFKGKDPLGNGMLIGGAVGGAMGLFTGCEGASSNCTIAEVTLGTALLGGAVGAWIDSRRHGRIVIYQAGP